jgi:hypothetical protein
MIRQPTFEYTASTWSSAHGEGWAAAAEVALIVVVSS